ncbi:hypothetical protein Q8F55_005422 [Vanrija albida]|uniref:F-box domain-containing protein n=1 Tax=Vanrija albida TaxID=181172 RepID=A0ABR3Q1L5_9TREE
MGAANSRLRGREKEPPRVGTRLLLEAEAASIALNWDSGDGVFERLESDPLGPVRAICRQTQPKIENKRSVKSGRPTLYGIADFATLDELDTILIAINACGTLDSLSITLKGKANEVEAADLFMASVLDALNLQLRKLTLESQTGELSNMDATSAALVRFFAHPVSDSLEEVRICGSTTGARAERNFLKVPASLDMTWTSRTKTDYHFEPPFDYSMTTRHGYDWDEHNRELEQQQADQGNWADFQLTNWRRHEVVRTAALCTLVKARVLLHALPGPGGSPFTTLPAEIIHKIVGYTDTTLKRPQLATVLRYAEDRRAFTRVAREWNRREMPRSWNTEKEHTDRRNEWMYNGGFLLSHGELVARKKTRK